jgi:hypothetical protein
MRHGWKRAPVRLEATEEVVMLTGTVRRLHRRQHRPRQEQLLNGGAEMLQAQTWRRRASHALPLLLHCGKSLECTCAMNRECSIARAWQWLLRHGPAGGNWWQRWRVPRCSALACCQHGQTQLSSHIDLGPFCSNISGRECLRNLARCHSCRSQFAAPSWRRQRFPVACPRPCGAAGHLRIFLGRPAIYTCCAPLRAGQGCTTSRMLARRVGKLLQAAAGGPGLLRQFSSNKGAPIPLDPYVNAPLGREGPLWPFPRCTLPCLTMHVPGHPCSRP